MCVSDDDDDNNNNNNNNNNATDIQRIGFRSVDWTSYSQDRIQDREYVNNVMNRIYTGYPGRNVPDFGRMFLMLKYTDITQNTYIQI